MEEQRFNLELNKRIEQIEKVLKQALPKEITLQKTICEAMEYSLMAGGKRLRPMMLLESYHLFGGVEDEVAAPFMAAMEMIHTYSLVHDDLPAMDNDEYRRGRKTTHVVYGEDMGILAGDALLNYAYETMASALNEKDGIMNGVGAMKIISQKAGVYGMVGGQVVDVEMTGKPLSESMLQFIFELKTGALIEGALMAGASLAGASQEEIKKMEQIGHHIGMAFQIQDDILDVVSTTKELGKPVHSDEKNEKTTYVSLYGLEEAKKAVMEYSEKAMELLRGLPGENEFLSTLVESLIYRKK